MIKLSLPTFLTMSCILAGVLRQGGLRPQRKERKGKGKNKTKGKGERIGKEEKK
jgi:hypothetical protein